MLAAKQAQLSQMAAQLATVAQLSHNLQHYVDPQLPSIIPQIPTIKDHKGSIKGPLGVLVKTLNTES